MKVIGYLCSEFPALSHTFISREIGILEQEGFTIRPASVNPTRNPDKLSPEDQLRAAQTYVLKATPKARILAKLLAAPFRGPRFFGALIFSLKLCWFGGPRDLGKTLGYFVQAVLLHSWAREKGIGHIHVHFGNPASTVALIATRLGSLDFSLSVHGPDELYDVEKNNLREKIRDAVFVRCIGYYCQSQLMRLSPPDQWKKFHIVRCGLLPGEIQARPHRPGPARNLLCVGRLCPSKGQAILVEAARRLKAEGLDFHLLLLGGGEDLESLQAVVAEGDLASHVTLAGPVGHARVKEELAKTDLFVLPSFAEGIPVALMEAMAAGVPVVSTNITGIPELIEHGVDGFLTQPSNVDQLVEVLGGLIRGTVDTRSFHDRAVEKVRTLYDVGANTKALGLLFESLRR